MADQSEYAVLSALAGASVVAAEDCRWGFENRTTLVTLANGQQRIIQQIRNHHLAAHKIRLAQQLPQRLGAVGITLPTILRANATAQPPFLVRDYLPGTIGSALLDSNAAALARAMGALLPKLAQVDTANLGLHTLWAHPERLAYQAQRQLAQHHQLLASAHVLLLEATIAEVPHLFAQRPAVFAHGDFCPVNSVFQLESPKLIAGLIDIEFARLADPLFDAAWWGWVVRFHHPQRWAEIWPQFLAAANIPYDELSQLRMRALQQLRLLEVVDYYAGDAERGSSWAERLADTLEWA